MGVLQRMKNLWRREELDAEIDEELRSHLEMAAEDAGRAGMPPDEARRSARRRFGNRRGHARTNRRSRCGARARRASGAISATPFVN